MRVTIRVYGSIHRARCRSAQNSRIAFGTTPVVRPNSSFGSQSCLIQSVLQARRTQKYFGVSEALCETRRKSSRGVSGEKVESHVLVTSPRFSSEKKGITNAAYPSVGTFAHEIMTDAES